MRNKLIALLRSFENESSFKNHYIEFLEEYWCDYSVEEHLDFPDYRFVIKSYNDKYPISRKGITYAISSNSISAELRRMEADGLVMIGVQNGIKYATTASNQGPDFDEDITFASESIVLTTKGKSNWKYFLYKVTQDPVALAISIVALVISIFAIFV